MAATPALADITVGVTVSATGPAASLGIPEKNTIDLMPKTIAGQKVNYIVLDDASDGTELKFHWVTVTAWAGTDTAANAAATTRCLIMEVSLDGEGQASREPADHRR